MSYARYSGLGSSGGSGTVTSVGLADGSTVPLYAISGSPVTTSGTLTFTLATQVKNLVLAGPATGSNAQPTFRALVIADLPVFTASRAIVSDSGGALAVATTTSTEIGFVNGVTSSIQTQLNGKQASGNYITALTGDITASGPGSVAATLATVNSNVGSFGSSTAIPSFTVNGKGLITAASTNVVVAPAGTLTGTTLASNIVTSSLTSVGTIASGVWNGTVIDVAHGGTGLATLTANNVILGNGTSTPNLVAPSTSGNILTSNGTTWTSAVPAAAAAGTLTGTTLAANVVTSSLTTVGTIGTGVWNGTTIAVASGGTGLATLTANNVILGNGASNPTFVAPSTSGNVLTSNGTTWTSAVPVVTTSKYASSYFATNATWSTTSATFADPTNATSNTLTSIISSGITLTAAGSSKLGVTFTPSSSSAVYYISVFLNVYNNTVTSAWSAAKLWDGTTLIGYSQQNTIAANGFCIPNTITGIYAPGTGSAVTITIQLAAQAGTVSVTDQSALATPAMFTILQIK